MSRTSAWVCCTWRVCVCVHSVIKAVNRKDCYGSQWISSWEKKPPHIHFSALSTLKGQVCWASLWLQCCFLLCSWGVAYNGALRLAVVGPCDLLCGLMKEGQPREHSLSRVCVHVSYVTVWCRITGCTRVYGVATSTYHSPSHAHTRTLAHTHTHERWSREPSCWDRVTWLSRVHVPGLPFSSRFYSLPHKSSSLAVFSRMNTRTH